MVWLWVGIGIASALVLIVWTLCRAAHAIDEVLDVLERFPPQTKRKGDER